MSYAMQKLRALLPGQQQQHQHGEQRQSGSFEPEIGFQISLEASELSDAGENKTFVPELNVRLLAARHLPTLFGFKIVQGYLIKVKLFPGSKRLDSSIQTNSWPKFNENFRFPLQPALKPSLKHSKANRRNSKTVTDFIPDEIFAGQFVVFTVYALLELPPVSFNRLNRTYRSLRDKSSNLVQKIVENSATRAKDERRESLNNNKNNDAIPTATPQQITAPAPPPLTYSEAKRNIGSVTCYLEPKIFKRNARTGVYTTEELWLPIKDITSTTTAKTATNNLANASKGVVEIALELRDQSANGDAEGLTPTPTEENGRRDSLTSQKHSQWNRMTAEMKRKMGISNTARMEQHKFLLCVSTTRMRCSNKVKDELESNAGSIYVKTTVFEHGIYLDSWKSDAFFPSLSIMWEQAALNGSGTSACTLLIPLRSRCSLEHISIHITLATKTKMNKKLVLGTVIIAGTSAAARGCNSGLQHMQQLLQAPANERVCMWHSYQ